MALQIIFKDQLHSIYEPLTVIKWLKCYEH